MGLWQTYTDPKIVSKLGETMTKGSDTGWEETGLWMHCLGSDGEWVSPDVKKSAEAVKGLDMGSKLFEIPGLGHGTPGDIADVFDFIFSPREGSSAKGGVSSTFNVDPVISSIRTALKSNPAKAKETMIQLWRNHPEVHDNEKVKALLTTMDALP